MTKDPSDLQALLAKWLDPTFAITVQEAASRLGVSERRIYALIQSRRLQSALVARHRLVRVRDVERERHHRTGPGRPRTRR